MLSSDIVTFYAIAQCYTSPTFQWKKNNINVGTNNNIYTPIQGSVSDGDVITCVMGTYTSNEIIMTVTS